MVFRSRRQSRFTVATMFCRVGTIPSTAVICCCSSVRGAGVEGTCVVDDVEAIGATVAFDVTGAATAGGEGGLAVT